MQPLRAPKAPRPDVGAETAVLTIPDRRSTARGLAILAVHYALYLATLAGALAPLPLALNFVSALANGVFIALLFIIAHDGAHGSFVPGRRFNRAIARFAFIPCAHSLSLWRVIHNKRHHGRTNLKDRKSTRLNSSH